MSFRRIPIVGEFEDRFFCPKVNVKDKDFGVSSCPGIIPQITVDQKEGMPGNVGKIVKEKLFIEYPKFIFNVCFSCGKSIKEGKKIYSQYCNPESIWFNVFFGYYQIDVPTVPYIIDINQMNNVILKKIPQSERKFLIDDKDGVYSKRGKKYYLKSKYKKNITIKNKILKILSDIGFTWNRPFGYQYENNKITGINFNDVLKIGKSDWNYFSNYMYGVPDDFIKDLNDINNVKDEDKKYLGLEKINNKFWDIIEVDNVKVVTAYDTTEGNNLIINCKRWTPTWRNMYGKNIKKRDNFDVDFFPVNMKAKIMMSFKKVEKNDLDLKSETFRTFFFGGTLNNFYSNYKQDKEKKGKNEKFLELQIEAAKKVMKGIRFKNIGFTENKYPDI